RFTERLDQAGRDGLRALIGRDPLAGPCHVTLALSQAACGCAQAQAIPRSITSTTWTAVGSACATRLSRPAYEEATNDTGTLCASARRDSRTPGSSNPPTSSGAVRAYSSQAWSGVM